MIPYVCLLFCLLHIDMVYLSRIDKRLGLTMDNTVENTSRHLLPLSQKTEGIIEKSHFRKENERNTRKKYD